MLTGCLERHISNISTIHSVVCWCWWAQSDSLAAPFISEPTHFFGLVMLAEFQFGWSRGKQSHCSMYWLNESVFFHSAYLRQLLNSRWNLECSSCSNCKTRKAKVNTNSLSLVSEGCHTLFARSRDVSLASKARLFSFRYLLLCIKYIILLLLLTKKPGSRSPSPSRVWKLNIAFKS